MNAETRAARDSLAAFLALPEYASDDVRVLGLCRSGQSHYDATVTTGQLRTILAALDQHEVNAAAPRRISPINGCTETTCGCQHVGSCRD